MMDCWMHEVVSMMEDGTTARIKQEIDSCCSPSPTSSNNNVSILSFGSNGQEPMDFKCGPESILHSDQTSPGSPDRQFCSSTTSAIGDFGNDSNVQDTVKEELPRRLCLVCGDVASGFHYGVASCEACKAFFKRTIQGNIEYTCPANNDCEINKRRRKACQACRFRKCLMMGMLKEGVRLDRVRGGRQKYRRNPNMQPYQLQIPHSSAQPPQSLDDIKMLDVLMTFEPEKLCVGHCGIDLMNKNDDDQKNECVGTDAQEMLNILSDLYDKELVGVIGWAKQIPGFTDLPLNDQMRLLQVSWAEILTLMLAFRSIPFTGRLYFASDFWLDERSAKECGATELYNHCIQITQRLEKISASKEEYYLLKALTLSNCDIRLDNYDSLKKLRESILSALNDCVLILRHYNAVAHQQKLLLLLPSLRQADHIIRRFWMKVHKEGNITMNKLFVEMLESFSR
ncbi:steroid hormone receptor ERR2 isoform X1 [Chironomus tepperi]|uniref:steroid hormone receptor ERR2 isoform X1 n=2 Tax=Chironomus tepperi TaxID=113505 RepID=UPI00391F1C85